MLDETLELIHAARTGQFPEPGALRDQPERVRQRYAIVQQCVILADRAMSMRGMV